MKKKTLQFLLLLLFAFAYSCEPEETCETKQSCFTQPDGSQECFDVPVNCIENDFGF